MQGLNPGLLHCRQILYQLSQADCGGHSKVKGQRQEGKVKGSVQEQEGLGAIVFLLRHDTYLSNASPKVFEQRFSLEMCLS